MTDSETSEKSDDTLRGEALVAAVRQSVQQGEASARLIIDQLRALGGDPYWLDIAWREIQIANMAILRSVSVLP